MPLSSLSWSGAAVVGLLVACGGRVASTSATGDEPGARDGAADGLLAPGDGMGGGTLCGSQPVALASGLPNPAGLAVGAGNIYFTTMPQSGPYPGGVFAVPVRGGSVVTIDDAQQWPFGIAVAGDEVYWANQCSGNVAEAPVAGGAVSALANTGGAASFVAVDSTNAYVTNLGSNIPLTGNVTRIGLDRSSFETLASAQSEPWVIAVDAAFVYWVNLAEPSVASGSVVKVPIAGGTPTTLVSGLVSPMAMTIDADDIYFSDHGMFGGTLPTGIVLVVPKSGGAPSTLISGQSDAVTSLAVDDTSVFWTTGSPAAIDGTVSRVAKGGGSPSTLATDQAAPTSIALDASCVYWANGGVPAQGSNGAVMMVGK